MFVGAVLAGVLATLVVMWATRADAAPGDSDTTFVPITACRLVDTRPASQVGPRNAPLGAADTYTVDVQHPSTECAGEVPAAATGLSLNVTAAQTTQQTFLTIWDQGPWPGTSSLNPVPGPPAPNAVITKLSTDDTLEIYNDAGATHVLVDITGYYTDASLDELTARLTALETEVTALEVENAAQASEITALETKTASMSLESVDGQSTVRFSGVNVQIVSGSGGTSGEVNGRGNLIIGYNETSSDQRTGSHNLVVGSFHSYTSYGGFLAGTNNRTSGTHASVSGGIGNTASGTVASVSGGSSNSASGHSASVSGGSVNTASGTGSSISGGSSNSATATWATVSGGRSNIVSGHRDTVAGGDELNCNVDDASGLQAVVCGEGTWSAADAD